MKAIIILLSSLTIFLFLLCVATILFIIKILRTKSNYTFYFRKNSRLYNLAFKDDLTDLYNRNAYIRDLRKLESKSIKSLCFSIFDIDDFKKVNDTKGHLFGDKILISAAERLCKVFPEKNHTVYRIGGDEFLVISKNISEDDLISSLLELKKIEKQSLDFRFSKGYSFVSNMNAECFDAAYDNADKMLYADKKSKKQNI